LAHRLQDSPLLPDDGPQRRELCPQHLRFFAAGLEFTERLFLKANRTGGTQAAAREVTYRPRLRANDDAVMQDASPPSAFRRFPFEATSFRTASARFVIHDMREAVSVQPTGRDELTARAVSCDREHVLIASRSTFWQARRPFAGNVSRQSASKTGVPGPQHDRQLAHFSKKRA
jgi:hypothetical protein